MDVCDVDGAVPEREVLGVRHDERDVEAEAPRPLGRLPHDAERDVREYDPRSCPGEELRIEAGAAADGQSRGAEQ